MADAKNTEKVSILVVEDEPSVGDALKVILESNGYEVILVATGTDGVEQARNRRFGFAIVDLFLKDICSYRVIKDIHEHQPRRQSCLSQQMVIRRCSRKHETLAPLEDLINLFLLIKFSH